MSDAVLRLSRSYCPFGVIGRLQGFGLAPLFTLERPWLFNQKNVSCIPPGEYVCRRVVSPKFGNTFEVCGVAGRSHILFHVLNWVEQSEGCIGVGSSVAIRGSRVMLLQSRAAMAAFMGALVGIDRFRLVIDSYAPDCA